MSTPQGRPDFTIVTPSFNSGSYLPRACASVADQRGATFEHIVVDGMSTDGTVEWLRANPRVLAIVGQDDGMYDAINRGLERSRGEIVAYLNCDEQYLPGTLAAVRDFFAAHPRVDVVYGDVLIVDRDGGPLAYRKGYRPRWPYIAASYLYLFSCSIFFRKRVIEDGHVFDPRFKFMGDAEFLVRLLRAGYRMERVPRYLAAFTITGDNLSISPRMRMERRMYHEALPRWVRCLRHPLNAARLVERSLSGACRQALPLEYDLYSNGDLSRRRFRAEHISFRWPGWETKKTSPQRHKEHKGTQREDK